MTTRQPLATPRAREGRLERARVVAMRDEHEVRRMRAQPQSRDDVVARPRKAQVEHDEVRPHLTAAMHERLRCGERVVFDDSSHMPHIEEPDRFLAVVQDFLARCEA